MLKIIYNMILKKESIFEISEITGYTMSNIMNLLRHKKLEWRYKK
jgi:hypothetical protein